MRSSRCSSCCWCSTPGHNVHLWFITYPANINALVSLVSFGVSGIYLSFLLTVIGAIVARARGWVPEGSVPARAVGMEGLDRRARVYLGLMLVNVVARPGYQPRAYFNLDWITLLVMAIVAVVGAISSSSARPDSALARHVHDEARAHRRRASAVT